MLSLGLWGQRDLSTSRPLPGSPGVGMPTAAQHNTLGGGLALKMTAMGKNLVLHSSQSPKFWAQHPGVKSHCNSKLASAEAVLLGVLRAGILGALFTKLSSIGRYITCFIFVSRGPSTTKDTSGDSSLKPQIVLNPTFILSILCGLP